MNIITVIPLSRSKLAPELSYFTAADIPVGAIVTVPVRSKSIHAVVTGIRAALDIKTDIKNAPFEIRKLSKVRATAFFPAAFMEAAEELALYYATTAGNIIHALTSEALLEQASKIAPPLPPQASLGMDARPRLDADRIFAVQGDDDDRTSSWRSLIRQEFARKRSIAVYAPTFEDVRAIFAALEKGIEGYIFALTTDLSKKKLAETWTKIAETEHPVVIVTTGSFSLLPRGDIDHIVIERENARGWISAKTPYLDLRHAIETVARKRRQTVFVADSLLSTATLYRVDQGEIDHGSPFKWRSISDARDILIDMKNGARTGASAAGPGAAALPRTADEPPHFRVLSRELEELIATANESSTNLFIMTLRRGSATTTVCADCETIVRCHACGAPVVLHASPTSGKNFFMCHKCGERRSADEICATCGGWRLTPLGIGIERVAAEIKSRFPLIEVFQIDADLTKTDREIGEAMRKFREKPGSILLGTEMAWLRLSGKIDHVAVVSLDSLFALPDFRMQEKIMYTLVRLRAQATRTMLVQTRQPQEKVFEYGLKGNLSDFYRMTIQERKQFTYPPLGTLVKLTIEGKKEPVAAEMAGIQTLIAPYEIDVFPAFTASHKGNSLIHGLIKMESHAWPDPELVRKLKSLPPSVSVKVNPESLL